MDSTYHAIPPSLDGEHYDSLTSHPHGAGGNDDPHPSFNASFIPRPSPTSASDGPRMIDHNAYDSGVSSFGLTVTHALGPDWGR